MVEIVDGRSDLKKTTPASHSIAGNVISPRLGGQYSTDGEAKK